MFEQKNPLPSPELQSPVGDGYGQLSLRQGALDVRRHVVGALVVMPVKHDIFGDNPTQKSIEIASHVGRIIFLDQ